MICDLFLYLLHFKHFIFLACTMVVADTGSLAFLLSIMFLSWWNARLFFWSFLSGMHLPRMLDNARSILHMGFWKKSHCQFSSRDLLEQDEVWGSTKTEERREGLYESSRAVTLVDGLPRAPSSLQKCMRFFGNFWHKILNISRPCGQILMKSCPAGAKTM